MKMFWLMLALSIGQVKSSEKPQETGRQRLSK